MKHLYLTGALLCASSAMFGQFSFDPSIEVDYNTEEIIVPPSPLKTQILFIGGVDMVQTTQTYDNAPTEVPAKEWHDFIGFTPDDESEDMGWLTINHEMIQANENIGDGGGMTAFKIKRDPNTDTIMIVEQTLLDGRSGKFFNVDFVNTVGETGMNCGGIVGPDGRIWTAEEWFRTSNLSIFDNRGAPGVMDTVDFEIDSDIALADGKTVAKYENFNYMVEIDPKQAKAIRKQYNWGRNAYEGGAILQDNKTVFLGHDGTPGFMTKFIADEAGDFTEGHTYVFKEKSESVQGKLSHFSTFKNAMSEISAFDAEDLEIYSTYNGEGLLVVSMEDPRMLDSVTYVDLSAYGGVTSVAVYEDLIAVAIDKGIDSGSVVILDQSHAVVKEVQVGSLPDMVTFSPNGDYIVVACEGEPNDDYTIDPEGLVSVIDVSAGASSALVAHADFKDWSKDQLDASVRIFGNGTDSVALDLEPEYVAITKDSRTAIVSLQENNALAVVDIPTATVTDIIGLGFKDHSVIPLDPSNEDDSIAYLRTYDNLYGMYQPDAIAIVELGGQEYILTANEGDARDYDGYSEETRVKDLMLDSVAFPNWEELQEEANLGRLKTTTSMGDWNNDGYYEEIYCYGGRSFSIWTLGGELVFDSETDFAEIVAQWAPENYADGRDDDKGSEPESITTLTAPDGETYAFIGLERATGVMVYNITDPDQAYFVDYYNKNGYDLSPEGLLVVSPDMSPDGTPYLISSNEPFDDYTGSISAYNIHGWEKGNWVEINNKDFKKMLYFQDEAIESGATMFNRLEWVWASDAKDAVFFTETGRDNPASRWSDEAEEGAQWALHHVARGEDQGTSPDQSDYWDYYGRVIKLDLTNDSVSIFLEGGPHFANDSVPESQYPDIHLSNPDGLSGFQVKDKYFMIIQEDLNGTSYGRVPADITTNRTCEMFLLDLSIENPSLNDLIRISVVPQGAEITGAIASPDGNTIFVNSQHPSTDNPYPYNHSLTYAITGWADITLDQHTLIQDQEEGFTIYPNPAYRKVMFNKMQDVAIYNAEGKRIKVVRGVNSVDISNLNEGIYFIQNKEGETKKLVIQK